MVLKKAIYCVDNVDTSVSDEDLLNFFTDHDIKVVSVYEAKPRRRKSEKPVTDRRAFRVCVDSDDLPKFLNADIWPNNIVVYEWFFKAKNATTPSAAGTDKTLTASNTSTPITGGHSDNVNQSDNMDLDQTISTGDILGAPSST